MRLIDTMMMNIGAVFLIAGGVLLVSALFGFAIHLVGNIWIAASNKWRRILRAESLIYEYRQNRDEYMRWKHSHTVDAVAVVRCKDCARCVTHKGVPICNKWRTFPEVELDGFCSYGERKEG